MLCYGDQKAGPNEIVAKFNETHPTIQLFGEQIRNNHLSVLDSGVAKNLSGSIQRDFFRKSKWIGWYILHHSFVPIRRGRILKDLKLKQNTFSDDTKAELHSIHVILSANRYPGKFMHYE